MERGAKFAPDNWETSRDVKHERASMSTVGEQQVLDALRQVRDSERGGDIVSLGMVSGLAVRDGHVAFALEVEPARAERLEPLRKAAGEAVDRLPGVLSGRSLLTAQKAAPTP